MWEQILPGLRIKIFMTIVLGIIYPLAMTGISQALFSHRANGSLIRSGNQVIGSELLGQNFTKPEYFHPRPSSAGNGYDATASSGSNLGPTSAKLLTDIKTRVDQYRAENGLSPETQVPADAVTGSASGLDPHISPANATMQAARVARARGIAVDKVTEIIARFTEPASLGLLGEPRLNVLKLNMALDGEFPRK
jgi:K+-transporting ATPase ATPase C chain